MSDNLIRFSYPYPMAALYQEIESITYPDEMQKKYELLLDMYDCILKTLNYSLLGLAFHHKKLTPVVKKELETALKNPIHSNWTSLLSTLLENFATFRNPLSDSIRRFYLSADPNLARIREGVYHLFQTPRSAKDVGEITIARFFDDFSNFLKTGSSKLSQNYAGAVDTLLPVFKEILGKLDFYRDYTFAYVPKIQMEGKSFDHSIDLLSGIKQTRDHFISDEPLASRNRKLYLFRINRDGLEPLFCFHPFIIVHKCKIHNANEVYFLQRQHGDDMDYISYQCGERFKPERLLIDYQDTMDAFINHERYEVSDDIIDIFREVLFAAWKDGIVSDDDRKKIINLKEHFKVSDILLKNLEENVKRELGLIYGKVDLKAVRMFENLLKNSIINAAISPKMRTYIDGYRIEWDIPREYAVKLEADLWYQEGLKFLDKKNISSAYKCFYNAHLLDENHVLAGEKTRMLSPETESQLQTKDTLLKHPAVTVEMPSPAILKPSEEERQVPSLAKEYNAEVSASAEFKDKPAKEPKIKITEAIYVPRVKSSRILKSSKSASAEESVETEPAEQDQQFVEEPKYVYEESENTYNQSEQVYEESEPIYEESLSSMPSDVKEEEYLEEEFPAQTFQPPEQEYPMPDIAPDEFLEPEILKESESGSEEKVYDDGDDVEEEVSGGPDTALLSASTVSMDVEEYVVDETPLLLEKDIVNIGLLLKSLKEDEDPSVKRVWDLLDAKTKKAVNKWKAGRSFKKTKRQSLINSLNKIISKPDFYNIDDFISIEISDEGKDLVEKGLDKLPLIELQMFNRQLMESIFPREIARRDYPEERILSEIKPEKPQEEKPPFVEGSSANLPAELDPMPKELAIVEPKEIKLQEKRKKISDKPEKAQKVKEYESEVFAAEQSKLDSEADESIEPVITDEERTVNQSGIFEIMPSIKVPSIDVDDDVQTIDDFKPADSPLKDIESWEDEDEITVTDNEEYRSYLEAEEEEDILLEEDEAPMADDDSVSKQESYQADTDILEPRPSSTPDSLEKSPPKEKPVLKVSVTPAAQPAVRVAKNTAKLLAEAKSCLQQEKYDRAREICSTILEQDPDNLVAKLLRGKCDIEDENFEQAYQDLSAVLEVKSEDPTLLLLHGRAALEVGRLKEAMKELNEVTKKVPNNPDAWLYRGMVHLEMGKFKKAIKDFNRAAKLSPDDPEIYLNRGNVNIELWEYENALQDYNRAIKLDPEDPYFYFQRGNAYFLMKEYQMALKDFNKAIELDSEDTDFYVNRGVAFIRLGQFDKAREDFDKVIQGETNFVPALIQRGNLYRQIGENLEALKDFSWLIDLEPDSPEGYVLRGNLLVDMEKYKDALEDFDEASAIDPEYVDAYTGKANTMMAMEKYNEAIDIYTVVIDMDAQTSEAYLNRGIAYEKLGQIDQAKEDFNSYLQLNRLETGNY